MNVRVTLVRGRFRVVVVGLSSSSSSSVRAVVCSVDEDSPLLDVVDDPEVEDGLMSVVSGGLVLVIVWVVVPVVTDCELVAEYVGAM